MAVLNPKSKMISLRLSDEELENVRRLYRVRGSRSISEFLRDAIREVVARNEIPSGVIEDRLTGFDQKLDHLDREIERLSRTIANRLGVVEIPPAAVA